MLSMKDFLTKIEAAEPGLLGSKGASHEVVGSRVHLISKDHPDGDVEVWIYPNADGTFSYQRGNEVEIRNTINDLIEAVFGNDPGETAAGEYW
ncbi:hypothetical protein IFT66_08260 [Rhizobium sp. CFBP 13726]|uniref:hypothetical protein n=1 Tax=Rhizobium sp. CFBP 13726 TaxID=2775296 RepID=UPI0017808DAF|nr:hypothetical protein [Rhizobium sp. CFBP 13726]MBD8651067.1 hypothetical protein [Rhizobium sp. CFBP 13726]